MEEVELSKHVTVVVLFGMYSRCIIALLYAVPRLGISFLTVTLSTPITNAKICANEKLITH